MHSHEVDYEILGDSMQLVEVELDPGEARAQRLQREAVVDM